MLYQLLVGRIQALPTVVVEKLSSEDGENCCSSRVDEDLLLLFFFFLLLFSFFRFDTEILSLLVVSCY